MKQVTVTWVAVADSNVSTEAVGRWIRAGAERARGGYTNRRFESWREEEGKNRERFSTGMRDANRMGGKDERERPESGEKLKPEMKSALPGHAPLNNPTGCSSVASTRGSSAKTLDDAASCRDWRPFGAGLGPLLKKRGVAVGFISLTLLGLGGRHGSPRCRAYEVIPS